MGMDRTLAVQKRRIKEDFTNRCICKPANSETVGKCHACLKNYDVAQAEKVMLPVRRCDPNFGVQGPLYRLPNNPDEDEDENEEAGGSAGGVSRPTFQNTQSGEDDGAAAASSTAEPDDTAAGQRSTRAKTRPQQRKNRKNRKVKSVAPGGTGGVAVLFWWIGIQIVCVIGATVYFMM